MAAKPTPAATRAVTELRVRIDQLVEDGSLAGQLAVDVSAHKNVVTIEVGDYPGGEMYTLGSGISGPRLRPDLRAVANTLRSTMSEVVGEDASIGRRLVFAGDPLSQAEADYDAARQTKAGKTVMESTAIAWLNARRVVEARLREVSDVPVIGEADMEDEGPLLAAA